MLPPLTTVRTKQLFFKKTYVFISGKCSELCWWFLTGSVVLTSVRYTQGLHPARKMRVTTVKMDGKRVFLQCNLEH